MTKLEDVARAIRDKFVEMDIASGLGDSDYLAIARTAVEELREPTEKMRQAARDVWKAHEAKRVEITGGNGSLAHPDWEVHYHQAMLDAILNEKLDDQA
jgi:hypothetical protein